MARVVHYFPLEDLDQRYTRHLDESIQMHFSSNNIKNIAYYPHAMQGRESIAPMPGHFLNAAATCEFKARQLAMLAESYANGNVQDGDVLFFSDLWFPGIEMVRYMDFFTHKRVEIRGILHAGSWTDTDFVRQMERWASPLENAWLDQYDKVFVGSEFMKKDLCQKRLINTSKVHATGFPLDKRLNRYPTTDKRDLVVFNGRDCDEKQPWLWDDLQWALDDRCVEFIWTTKEGYKKEEYYDILSQAKVVVSFALQENFGFGILEAVKLGCVPVVPNRLVYPEHFQAKYRYKTFEECVEKVNLALDDKLPPPPCPNFDQAVEEWFR